MWNSPVGKCIRTTLWKNAGIMAVLIIAILGVVLCTLIPPQILRTLIDTCLVPGVDEGLMKLAFLYLGVSMLTSFFDFLKGGILTVMGQRITKDIRRGMMEKLSNLSATYFSANDPGFMVSRFTNDVDTINTLFSSGVIGMFIDCFKILGILVSIWMFSGKLALVVLLVIPVIFTITRIFQKKMLNAQIQNRVLVGRVNNLIAESLAHVRMIKGYSKEHYMEEKYTQRLMENYRMVEKVNFYDSVFSPIIVMLRAVVIVFVVMASSEQLSFLGITLGMVAASLNLIGDLFVPIENLGMELQNIQQAVSGIRRVNDFFESPEQPAQDPGITAETIVPDRNSFELKFEGLHFHYPDGPEVLKEIDLRVSAGERVTFVGRTGVGKSTLFKLVMGLLEPTQGRLTLNGRDLCAIPNGEKRRLFGYVDQSFHLIPGTAEEQISLKDPAISREQVEHALEFVGLLGDLQGLPQGLDTPVGRIGAFSQGQKQLLAIARAIVTDPPILLLDEITANMDSVTEERIVSVLTKAGASRTILTISHRLSSMLSCDRVVILENGRVRGSGAPEELLERDSWYRDHLKLERLTWG